MSKEKSGIQKAVAAAGSQSELARRIGVSPQAVQQWVERGCVPPRRVPMVAAVTGVSPHMLNPESHVSHPGPFIPGSLQLGSAVCDEPAGYAPEANGKKKGG